MSNCYTHFSEELKLKNKTQKKWIEKQLTTAWVTEDGVVHLAEPGSESAYGYEQAALFLCNAVAKTELEYDTLEEMCEEIGFAHEFRDDADGLRMVITADESGNVEAVAHFVQQFMQKFYPDDSAYWSMTWADVVDNDAPGGYGGGWMFISATRREMAGSGDEIFKRVQAPWAKDKQDLASKP